MKWLKKYLSILLAFVMSILWLSELSRRLARENADEFMRPMLKLYEWEASGIDFFNIKGLSFPFWRITYRGYGGAGESFSLEVSLLGQVEGANWNLLTYWLTLPIDQRIQEQLKLIDEIETEKKGIPLERGTPPILTK